MRIGRNTGTNAALPGDDSRVLGKVVTSNLLEREFWAGIIGEGVSKRDKTQLQHRCFFRV